MSVRWKDKAAVTPASDDRIPITDVSNSNTDGYATPSSLREAMSLPSSTTAGRLGRFTDTAGALGQTTGLSEDSSGRVGIGFSPSSSVRCYVYESDTSKRVARFEGGSGGTNSTIDVWATSALTGFGSIVVGNDLRLWVDNDGSKGIAIKSGGNVGIGLTSPAVKLDIDGPACVKSYTVATVPTASTKAAQIIYVSDESGGAVLAFSDGTNWRRVTDRAIIS